MPSTRYDIFLCHNNADKPAVRDIDRKLIDLGMRPWFDERDLPAGSPWIDELVKRVETIAAVAIFIGPFGQGRWQEVEIRAAISQAVERGCRLIPVFLENCGAAAEPPGFLSQYQAVDFRQNQPDPFARLVQAIEKAQASRTSKPTGAGKSHGAVLYGRKSPGKSHGAVPYDLKPQMFRFGRIKIPGARRAFDAPRVFPKSKEKPGRYLIKKYQDTAKLLTLCVSSAVMLIYSAIHVREMFFVDLHMNFPWVRFFIYWLLLAVLLFFWFSRLGFRQALIDSVEKEKKRAISASEEASDILHTATVLFNSIKDESRQAKGALNYAEKYFERRAYSSFWLSINESYSHIENFINLYEGDKKFGIWRMLGNENEGFLRTAGRYNRILEREKHDFPGLPSSLELMAEVSQTLLRLAFLASKGESDLNFAHFRMQEGGCLSLSIMKLHERLHEYAPWLRADGPS